ncbi:MAG: chromosome condensation regulator, partial [Actinomycetota bacterium]|nr:chromosome condensation regulator [Actinomycetota bacterium]
MAAVPTAAPAGGAVGRASQPTSPEALQIGLGVYHTCALLSGGQVRCWGSGVEGELGYPNTVSVGATGTPASAGPVELGPGRIATAISVGGYHTCAILDNGNVLCWGYGRNGRLGYGNINNVGDTQTPDTAGPVNLGAGRTA